MLDAERSDLPRPAGLDVQHGRITWTAPAVTDFWTFLLDLREKGTMGPLGISFHPAERSRQRPGGIRSGPGSHGPLSSIDYIKVYHPTARALYLRNVLDAWRYYHPPKKVRVLIDARLVLLDEQSRALLLV